MHRKDYETIAACLANAPRPIPANHDRTSFTEQIVKIDRENIALAIALELELDNPRFDRARFLAACGVA